MNRERETMAIEIRLVLRERGDDVREHRGEAGDDLDGAMRLFKRSCNKVVDRMRKFY